MSWVQKVVKELVQSTLGEEQWREGKYDVLGINNKVGLTEKGSLCWPENHWENSVEHVHILWEKPWNYINGKVKSLKFMY